MEHKPLKPDAKVAIGTLVLQVVAIVSFFDVPQVAICIAFTVFAVVHERLGQARVTWLFTGFAQVIYGIYFAWTTFSFVEFNFFLAFTSVVRVLAGITAIVAYTYSMEPVE